MELTKFIIECTGKTCNMTEGQRLPALWRYRSWSDFLPKTYGYLKLWKLIETSKLICILSK